MDYEILDPNPKRDNLQPVVECANGEEIGGIKPVDGKWEAHTNATARLSAPPMVFNSRDDAALAVYNEVQKHRTHAGEGDHALNSDAARANLLAEEIHAALSDIYAENSPHDVVAAMDAATAGFIQSRHVSQAERETLVSRLPSDDARVAPAADRGGIGR